MRTVPKDVIARYLGGALPEDVVDRVGPRLSLCGADPAFCRSCCFTCEIRVIFLAQSKHLHSSVHDSSLAVDACCVWWQ